MATVTQDARRRAERDATLALQRLDALERATEVRVLRAAMQVDIKEGRVSIVAASVGRTPRKRPATCPAANSLRPACS
ncbi:MAG TPA: hypothetical protein VGO80_12760 [Solirubrobacteraceae bacterium]|nr:hypothetical protein [Solirubrobacteraceae bacterium]